uniref:Ig-like domain-containing protein n=1 Tax=Megaselia scalaris TaxID=36166 RepID=T1GDX3_MEGSC
MVPEGGSAKLICRAKGFPQPKITWRREDGREIIARNGPHGKTKGSFDLFVYAFHYYMEDVDLNSLIIRNYGTPYRYGSILQEVDLNHHDIEMGYTPTVYPPVLFCILSNQPPY